MGALYDKYKNVNITSNNTNKKSTGSLYEKYKDYVKKEPVINTPTIETPVNQAIVNNDKQNTQPKQDNSVDIKINTLTDDALNKEIRNLQEKLFTTNSPTERQAISKAISNLKNNQAQRGQLTEQQQKNVNDIVKGAEDITGIIGAGGWGAIQGVANIGKGISTAQDYVSQKTVDVLNAITGQNKQAETPFSAIKDVTTNASDRAGQVIQSTVENASNPVAKKITEYSAVIGNMAPSIAGNAINPVLGTSMFVTSATGGYLKDAEQRGLTGGKALAYATAMGAVEGLTEKFGLGKLGKAMKSVSANLVGKAITEIGAGAGINAIQEALIEPVSEGASQLLGGSYDYSNMGRKMLKAGIDGAVVYLLMGGIGSGFVKSTGIGEKIANGQEVSQQEIQEALAEMESNGINVTEIQSEFNNAVNTVEKQIKQENGQANNYSVSNNSEFQQTVNNMRKQGYVIPQDRVDTIETFSKGRGVNVLFDNTLQEGVNGVYDGNTRTYKINPNSEQAVEFIAVHEMLHDMYGTKEYQELAKFVQEYANKTNEYSEARQQLENTYKTFYQKNNINQKQLDIDVEATNDMVARALGNQEFLNSLAQNKPKIFERFVNWIKEVGAKLFGTDKQKFLQDLKKKFVVAYNSQYNGGNGLSYHVSSNLSNDIDYLLKNGPVRGKIKVRDFTPTALTNEGVENIPMVMVSSHIVENILTEQEARKLGLPIGKRHHYHGIGKETFIKAIDSLDSPVGIFKWSKNKHNGYGENDYIILTSVENLNGERIIVPLFLKKNKSNVYEISTKTLDVLQSNEVKTVYGKKSVYKYLNNYLKDGSLKKIKINKSINSIDGLQSPTSTLNASIDNSIPKNNTDVNSYSMQNIENNTQSNDKWQEFLDNNFGLMENASRTYIQKQNEAIANDSLVKFEESRRKKDSLVDLAKLKPEDAKINPVSDYKSQNGTSKKTRQFYDNAQSAMIVSEEVKKQLTPTTYNEITNEESMKKAYKRLEEGGQAEVNDWLSKSVEKNKFDNVDIAEGFILFYQAQANGDTKTAVNIIAKLGDIGTKTGQTLQMFSMLQRLTPEGMLMYAQKELKKAFEVMSEKKSQEWIKENEEKFKLTEEDAVFIERNMKALQQIEDQRQKDILLGEISKRISDKLPPERGQGIKAYMRISMLFNPKTQVRNVLGNAGLVPINVFADTFATLVDKAIAKKTGLRTTNFTDPKTYIKGFKKGAYETIDDFKRGINTNMLGNRYEVNKDTSLFTAKSFNENTNNKVLNTFNQKMNNIDRILSTALSLGDRPFYEASFLNSIEGQMKANNVKVPSPEMIDIAVNEGLQRTWQDNSEFTKAVLKIRNILNEANINGYGLGDVLIPFAKTPANLTKAIVKYSPLNVINTIMKYNGLNRAIKKGEFTPQQQKSFVDNLGKTMAGSLLYIIGYGLAQSGVISGGGDEDKDIANYNKNVRGIQPYSFKIGDTSFTYNWLIPATVPFAIISDLTKEEKNLADTLTSAIEISADTLVEQSFMASINKVINNYDGIPAGIIEAVLDLPARAVPTLVKQFADLTDKKARSSYVYGDDVASPLNYAKSKIPFLTKTLEPVVNTMGEEVQRYGGDNNLFNVFLNPANVAKATSTKATDEIYRVYQEVGNKNVFPKVAPNYITYNKEKLTLTPEQKTKWQKDSGSYIKNNINKLINSSNYKNAKEEAKAKMLEELVNRAYDIAKLKFLNER